MSGLRGCATLIARVLAGLAAVALVVLLPVTLLARNIAAVLFEPRALTQAVSERLLESGLLRDTMVENLLGDDASVEGLSLGSATQYLAPEERQTMIDLLVPEGWVRDQVLQVTTEFLAWFDSPATRLVLSVDTSPVAAKLEGEAAAGVVEMVVESWPACTLEAIGQMIGIGAIPGEQGFPYCEPPEPLRGVVVSAATGALQLLGNSLPARLTIVDQGFEDSDKLMQTKEQVRMLRFVARWGILVSLSLLGVITMLAVRSWKGLTRWWGIPLLLGGLLAFLPVALGGRLLRLLAARLTAGMSAFPALRDMAQALAEAIGSAVLRPQAWQALVATGIGLVLLLMSIIGRRSRRAPQTDAPEAPARMVEPVVPPAPSEDAKNRPSGMFG
jgi:hypothetical protein